VVAPYLRTVLKDLHELTAVSEAAAEYVSSLTERSITLIPNGIDLNRYSRPATKKPTPGRKTILYIGRLEHRKGLRYLLLAYQRLIVAQENVQLIIAGDGSDREKLELLVHDLQLPHVSFLGYVDDETKMKLLAEADLFCSPAIFGESFGIVLLEAMASGLVAVAGNNAGYTAVMQELGALSIVNPKDTAEFARRLKLLLEDTKLRALWQNWARTYVKQFSYDKVVNQYERLYRAGLKRHAKSRVRTN